ncbi:MAG: hypothetical protein KDB27_06860 [Planctomycetales bacterium]|nr:hypothetical protein [Planctomycetales bacterium]
MNSANDKSPRRTKTTPFVRKLIRTSLVLWASPGTCLGLLIGTVGLMTGGGYQFHTGVLEFHGGATARFLTTMPVKAAAMTFGHVVLGRDVPSLDFTRDHERVHVRQYERWGPFFIPAYLFFSAALWVIGKDAYRSNPFEVEAYENS